MAWPENATWPGNATQLTQRSNEIAEEYSSANAMLASTGQACTHAEGPKRVPVCNAVEFSPA